MVLLETKKDWDDICSVVKCVEKGVFPYEVGILMLSESGSFISKDIRDSAKRHYAKEGAP